MSAASVIIPAHDEQVLIGELLDALAPGVADGSLDVIVVCNGCTDRTADVVRGHPSHARLVESPVASKHEALRLGDRLAGGFPRLYVDADVVITAVGARALVAALDTPLPRLVAPERVLDTRASSWMVRLYLSLWVRLPAVAHGCYGRGVIAVNEPGWPRLARRPAVIADDLFAHSAFAEGERAVVTSARSVVRAPRTTADLVRRRTRALAGNAELTRTIATGNLPGRTRVRDVFDVVRRRPGLLPAAAAFVLVTLRSRLALAAYRRRGGTGWLRDDSRRAHPGPASGFLGGG